MKDLIFAYTYYDAIYNRIIIKSFEHHMFSDLQVQQYPMIKATIEGLVHKW